MRIREQVALAAHTTLGLGGPARYWTEIEEEAEVPEALGWARERKLAVQVLGAGSNVLAADGGFDGLVLHIALGGVRFFEDGRVEAGAGEDWDALAGASVARGWAGIECLSGIPGTVGATPVQNVGAYGQEVSETIIRVRAWDREQETWAELRNEDCGFGYRASRFNGRDRGRFVIIAVEFRLRPGGAACVRYPELQRKAPPGATLAEVRAAVRELRRGKAMLLEEGDPDARSAGSFFKNPVVPSAAAPPQAPRFPAGDGYVKIPAAWLIEQAGIGQGFRLPGSGIHVSGKHVLALVNDGSGSAAEAAALAGHIRAAVERRWGVRLETEPVAVGVSL
ncbi:MAG: UDP-N-acetylmuramate dehydrogenase [Terriglobales bacterium]